MFDPLDKEGQEIENRLLRWRRWTALVMILESISLSLWRPLCWVLFFSALWFLQIPSIAGKGGEALAFLVFMAGMAYLGWQYFPLLRKPDAADADRRLEQESGLAHRPLSLPEDKLSNPQQPLTRKLWQYRKQTVSEALSNLRLPKPRPLLAGDDPKALRIGVLLLFFTGLVIAGPRWQERLSHGLTPFSFSRDKEEHEKVVVWINPPEYTGIGQITFQGGGVYQDTIDIPDGSAIKARVSGGIGKPSLIMGDVTYPMKNLGENTYGIEMPVSHGETLEIRQLMLRRAAIPYRLIEDKPPILTLKNPPKTLEKGELQFAVTVQDDYGVRDMYMHMDLNADLLDKPLGAPEDDMRAVMSAPGAELELNPVYDMAWHPWAGLPAKITLYATDEMEKKSPPETVELVLPERAFFHPLAKDLIAIRKKLIWTPVASAKEASIELENLMIFPDKYQGDIVVFLSLRSMSSRLRLDPTAQSAKAVIAQLWDTALRLEEGNLSIAARNLRDVQRKLEQALSDPNVTDEELAKLMQEMREAMAAYFTELVREMQKRMANGQAIPQPPEDTPFQDIRPEDLAEFLDQLQSQVLSGDKDSARQMLSQLQQLMDSINPSMSMKLPKDMQFMMEGISEMQKLIDKQEELLEQTRQQAEKFPGENEYTYPEIIPFDIDQFNKWTTEGLMPPIPVPQIKKQEPPLPEGIDTQEHQVEQDALRYILGQLMLEADEQLGSIPENMGKAEGAMRNSGKQLGENRPDRSVPHQEDAIKYLKEGMEQMSQQLAARMQQMKIMSIGGGMGPMDPLGRPYGEGEQPGWWPGSTVKIPDEAERKRVQDILKELRQRSGERNRPDYELDYFDRLLKQF